MIQRKGTNFAANAFANQKQYDGLTVDEFWAYKLATYGDSKLKTYPELKLFSNEVSRKELRLEFVEPLGAATDTSFRAVDLTDDTRWFEQPDQIEKLHPRDRFYVNAKVAERIEDVASSAAYTYENGSYYLLLSEAADGAVITYQVSVGPPVTRAQLVSGVDYEFVTNKLIKFISGTNPSTVSAVNATTLTYSYDAESPAKIINRRDGYVVNEVPVWNPARQQYYSGAIYGVDYRDNTDPANYTTNLWDSRFKDSVWFDTTYEYYLPFDDSFIQPDVNERMKNWGKLAQFGKIETYQWTASDVPPLEYDALSIQQEQLGTSEIDNRKTGSVRKLLYVNTSTYPLETWEEVLTGDLNTRDQVVEMFTDFVAGGSFAAAGLPEGKSLDIYVDSEYNNTNTYTDASFAAFASGLSGKTIHVVNPAIVPTVEQFDAFEYKYDVPYVTVNNIDHVTGNTIPTYYFWVRDRLTTIPVLGTSSNKTTLLTINKGLETIPTPYMIPNNLIDMTGSTFSDILNSNSPLTDSGVSYEFPYAYTRLVIKGIGGSVPSDDSYTLRFTKDFSLRDRLDDDRSPNVSELHRKNVHTEWKMFREKQFDKIDLELWNAVVESLLGFEYDGDDIAVIVPEATSAPTTPTPTPDVTPSSTPAPFVTPTPTVTPNVSPSVTPTPNVTPGVSQSATPLPSVTPSNTPVASVTPEPTPTPTPA